MLMIEKKKIIIPILIFAIIGGIWFIKNSEIQALSDEDINPDFTLHVTEKIDLEQLKSYGLPIMIGFGADYCPTCKEMAPVLEKINRDLQGKAIIKYVDIGKYQELVEGYPVRAIPTQVFFDKKGKPFTPADPEGMQMYLYSLRETNEHVFTAHEGGMTEEMILAALREMGLEE